MTSSQQPSLAKVLTSFHACLEDEGNGIHDQSVLVKRMELLFRELEAQQWHRHTSPNMLFLIMEKQIKKPFESMFHTYVHTLLMRWCSDDSHEDDENLVKSHAAFIRMFRWHELYEKVMLEEIHHIIDWFVSKLAHSSYSDPYLAATQQWFSLRLVPFLELMFSDSAQKKIKSHSYQLEASVCKLRTCELFEIVADFPDSLTAIRELKQTMLISENQAFVAKHFRKALCKRLLHPGASTSQILDMYISMVRAFRVLDSSDLLLNHVASPIRDYLKKRKDTVPCVVSSLAQGKESDLHSELRKGASLEYGQDEDNEEAVCAENWMPRQRHRELSDNGVSGLDILALLVSIYGSTDVFVSEYRVQLAEKLLLLREASYDIDNDMATLEHLKNRFGEECLHSCEIMLHDIEESKRANNSVASYRKTTTTTTTTTAATTAARAKKATTAAKVNAEFQDVSMECIIVSDNYWPKLPMFEDLLTLSNNNSNDDSSNNNNSASLALDEDACFRYHPSLQSMLLEYTMAFADLKKPRKLNVFSNVGTIELELEFNNNSNKDGDDADGDQKCVRRFAVSPLQATLILHLGEQRRLLLSQLASLVAADESLVQSKLNFWVSVGVVAEQQQQQGGGEGGGCLYVALDSPVVGSQAWRSSSDTVIVEELVEENNHASEGVGSTAVIEGFIKGILSNKESMSLERIHSLLKLLTLGEGDVRFEMNFLELQRLLQQLVAAEHIECIDNNYRILKK